MFEIGDRVKVVRKVVPEGFHWLEYMDTFIDSEYLIQAYDKHYNSYLIDNYFFPEESLEKVDDPVRAPSHYTYGKGLEVINVIDAFECGFEQGNVIKYVLRYKHKGGLQDLEKAKWYLEHLIEKEKNNSELIK